MIRLAPITVFRQQTKTAFDRIQIYLNMVGPVPYYIHIVSYSYPVVFIGSGAVSYSYIFEYIQNIFFRIVFLASTTSVYPVSQCL
jgi:hypothetical protein